MANKRGNGEGSIYPHKRNGKKVGYRGSYTVYTVAGAKRRYVSGKDRDEVRQSSRRRWRIGTVVSSLTLATRRWVSIWSGG